MKPLRATYYALGLAVALVMALALPVSAMASDKAKEQRWADDIVDALLDGEAVWLNSKGDKFLGIYTSSEDHSKKNAAIIIHGTGVHPDWQQVVQPLRVGLTLYDWNTLSIQMPILHNEAKTKDYAPLYDEAVPRIQAALDFLKKKGMKKIVIIGHSMGASMAAYYLSLKINPVDGFVGVGTPSDWDDDRMNTLETLPKIRVPMLDIYGTEDKDTVKGAEDRKDAFTNNNPSKYTAVVVKDADHFFNDHSDVLTRKVVDWLKRL